MHCALLLGGCKGDGQQENGCWWLTGAMKGFWDLLRCVTAGVKSGLPVSVPAKLLPTMYLELNAA